MHLLIKQCFYSQERTHIRAPQVFILNFHRFGFRDRLTLVTSEGAQGIFSKIVFLKSVHSKVKKNEACLGFKVKIFNKSVHRGGMAVCASFFAKSFDILIAHK